MRARRGRHGGRRGRARGGSAGIDPAGSVHGVPPQPGLHPARAHALGRQWVGHRGWLAAGTAGRIAVAAGHGPVCRTGRRRTLHAPPRGLPRRGRFPRDRLVAGLAAELATVILQALLVALVGLAVVGVLSTAIQRVAEGPLLLGPVFAFGIAVSELSMFGVGPSSGPSSPVSPYRGYSNGSAGRRSATREHRPRESGDTRRARAVSCCSVPAAAAGAPRPRPR